jgi:hypothetical protein
MKTHNKHMSDELALGQRELEVGGTFEPTPDEQTLLDSNNMTALAVQAFVNESGKQTINAAIGGLATKIAQAVAGAESAEVPTPEPSTEGSESAAPEAEEPKAEAEPAGEAPTEPAAE